MFKVLVVDDDANMRKLLDMSLQKAGFSVSLAREGNEAFIMAMDTPPDVAVLDVMMPGLHGYELCRRLRANPATTHTKIIFLTARSQPIDQKAGQEAGADLFLTKPVMPADLVEYIMTLVSEPVPRTDQVELPADAPKPAPVIAPEPELDSLDDGSKGTLIACFSLTPQVGVTTVAINLALAFALSRRIQVPLVELHAQPSGALAAMGLAAHADHMPHEAFSLAGLEAHLVKHPQGVQVFSAPKSDDPPWTAWIKPAVAALRRQFPITVADMTSKPDANIQSIFAQVDLMLLVTTPEVESIRATVRAIDGLRRLQFTDSNILLVINNIGPQAQVPVDKIEQGMKRQIFATIPYAPEAENSLRSGQPMILSDPHSPASQAIGRVAVRIARGLKLPGTTYQVTADA
ncbi:MAG: response regulator [Anaerolineae bacterium]|nr:response regulator [Anaerolineae bacterium]